MWAWQSQQGQGLNAGREGGREGGRGEERIARESRGGEGEAEDKQVLMR